MREHFHTVSKISPNQEFTHDGYLICFGTPIARTGTMIYGPDETPVEVGPDGIVHIHREDEDVFNDVTIASALGKPITISHPDDDVTPDTWKDEAHGITLNVKRGEGAMDDLLLADLMITTKEAIQAVQNGLVEVSMGYDADYEQLEPGKGRQTNIIINHIALVEQGRCGARCAIKDEETVITTNEESKMANRYGTKPAQINKKGLAKVMDLLFRANKAKDAGELNDIINEAAMDEELTEEENVGNLTSDDGFGGELEKEDRDVHIHIHNNAAGEGESAEAEEQIVDQEFENVPSTDDQWAQNQMEHDEFRARLDAIEAKLGLGGEQSAVEGDVLDDGEELEAFMEDEAPEGIPAKDARSARDSRYLVESMKDTMALAEILAPGIKMPTCDSKLKPGKMAKDICGLRKKALDTAFKSQENSAIFHEVIGNKTLDTSRMTCDAIRTVFKSAAALKRASNNSSGVRDSIAHLKPVVKKAMTLEEINAANAAFYASKK